MRVATSFEKAFAGCNAHKKTVLCVIAARKVKVAKIAFVGILAVTVFIKVY